MGQRKKPNGKFYRRSSFSELVELAIRWRRHWQIKGPRPNLLDILQKELRKSFPKFRLVVFEDRSRPGILAYSNWDKHRIGIARSMESAGKLGDDIAMNVFGEELAHYILRQPGMRFRAVDDHRARLFVAIDEQEREAKLFQALLIAPIDVAENCQTAAEIVNKFGLDEEPAQIYFEEIRLHSERKEAALKNFRTLEREDTSRDSGRIGVNAPTPSADLIIDLEIPKRVTDLALDIEHGAPRGRSILFGQVADGTYKMVEVVGTEREVPVPFVTNRLYVRFIQGKGNIKIIPRSWQELGATREITKNEIDRIEAQTKGYLDEPCPCCEERTLLPDASCKKCVSCFWTDSSATG